MPDESGVTVWVRCGWGVETGGSRAADGISCWGYEDPDGDGGMEPRWPLPTMGRGTWNGYRVAPEAF